MVTTSATYKAARREAHVFFFTGTVYLGWKIACATWSAPMVGLHAAWPERRYPSNP